MRKVLDHDPNTGVSHVWHWDEDTEETVITSEQNVDQIVHVNKLLYNEQGKKFGKDGTVVASVPMSIYHEWVQSGKINDQKHLFRWLNDPDNRHFRTHAAYL